MSIWWGWLKKECMTYRINDRLIIAGDHTKVAKDGRYMPAVKHCIKIQKREASHHTLEDTTGDV